MPVKIYPDNPNPREMERMVRLLEEGGVIVYPTDTLYAVGCDALNVRAVERICRIKGIDPRKVDLSILCNSLSDMSQYVKVNDDHFKLMRRNLPGAFTFILPTNNALPKIYKARKTVGIRVPDNAIARGLVALLGRPLLTASVDAPGEPDEYRADPSLIEERYGRQVDAVIDGGPGGTEPSTVVDCTGEEAEVVRPGKGELR